MIYFTSDPHYGHTNVIKYCNRPFANTVDMDRAMIHNWNSIVTPRDEVWVLGDFGFCSPARAADIVSKLNGKKTLVKGNHDKKVDKWAGGFDKVLDNTSMHIANQLVLISHYPYPPSEEELKLNPYDVRFLERRYQDDGKWLLHGHVHEKWKIRKKMINVGVDVWDFKPIPITTIEDIINGKVTG